MAAGLQHATGLIEVVSVRRCHMDDPDPIIVQEFVQVAIDPRNPQLPGRFACTVGRGAEQPDHLDPDATQRLDMHRADEAPADHGGRRALLG